MDGDVQGKAKPRRERNIEAWRRVEGYVESNVKGANRLFLIGHPIHALPVHAAFSQYWCRDRRRYHPPLTHLAHPRHRSRTLALILLSSFIFCT